MNTMAQSTQPSIENVSVAAVQPMSAGSAPGMAPTIVESDVRRLSGV